MANRSNNASQPRPQRRSQGQRSQSGRHNYNPYRCNPNYEFASRFNPNDTLDPFFTHVPRTHAPLRETQSNGRPLPALHSTLDAYAASEDPSHVRMSQRCLRADMFAMGANEDTLEQYMAAHNKVVQDLLDSCGGRLPSSGRKPTPGQAEERVMVYSVPNSHLTIRIWEGGMADVGHFCLDFVKHNDHSQAVNTPKGWKLAFVPLPGTLTLGGQLIPWEAALGFSRRRVPQGEERYSVPEGSRLALIRDGHPPFLFEIPTRPYCNISFHHPQPASYPPSL